jgi:hypothetical protein
MIASLYRPAPVPAWVFVAEEALRVWLKKNKCTTYYLPPRRRPGAGETHIYAVFKGLAEWIREGGSANGTPTVANVREEALRCLASEEWFEGSAGDISYLWSWSNCALVPLG